MRGSRLQKSPLICSPELNVGNQVSRAFEVITLYSAAHDVLYHDFFRASFPHPDWIVARRLELGGNAEFLSPEWQKAMAIKPAMIARHLRQAPEGSLVVYGDCDIQFLPSFSAAGTAEIFWKAGKDILFQKEFKLPANQVVNAGFCVMRASPRLAAFFEHVVEGLRTAKVGNDQPIINDLLPKSQITWGFLPLTFYARSHGFPPRRDAWIHHANFTRRYSTWAKLRQLRRVRRMLEGGTFTWYEGIAEDLWDHARSGGLTHEANWALGKAKQILSHTALDS